MEENKLGIDDTKKVLKFVIEFGEAIDKGMADGKLEVADVGLLVSPLMLLGPALEGFKGIGAELKDLSVAEMSELVTFVQDDLDIANDDIEKMIEDGIALAVRLYAFIQLFSKKDEPQPTPAA